MSGTLKVVRQSVPWKDKARAYKVAVDGQVVGSVKNDSTFQTKVEAGQHELRMKIDWTGSPTVPFEIADGQTVTFTCKPNGNSAIGLLMLARSIFNRDIWIQLQRAGV